MAKASGSLIGRRGDVRPHATVQAAVELLPESQLITRTLVLYSLNKFMTIKERSQDLNMVVELVREHMFENLSDSNLCKDMCAVVAINLRRVHDDTEKSANAWDKRTFHTKADELRRDMAWVTPMSKLAEMIAYSPHKFTNDDIDRLLSFLPEELEMPKRPRFKDVAPLRGAAAAARQTMLKKK